MASERHNPSEKIKTKEVIEREIQEEIAGLELHEKQLNEQLALINKKLEDLTPLKEALHTGYEYPKNKQELQTQISDLERKHAGLQRTLFGKIKDKKEETSLNTQIVDLRKKIDGLPREAEEARNRAAWLSPQIGIEGIVDYTSIVELENGYIGRKKILESQVKEKREKKEILLRPPGLLAHGGTLYGERRRLGRFPEIDSAMLEDNYGLGRGEITFGVGEKEGNRFIIIRQRQNIQNRGGYAYTLLLDPGEKIWRMANWNAALIVSNILQDPTLKKLLTTPEEFRMENIIAILDNKNWTATLRRDEKIIQLFQSARSARTPMIIGKEYFTERPTPEKFAEALTALSESERKEITWLIGGGGAHGIALGSKIVLDPERK